MSALRQIILDTETTGFNATAAENPDRLIEFAGLEMVNRQFTGHNLHLYVHPERDIPEEAIAVHGITLAQLTDKPKFAAVAQDIFEFIKGAELIIHNAEFDLRFLNAEFARVGLPKVETVCSVIDTLAMARDLYPGQKNSLDALCGRLDVDRSRRVLHGALIDCELLGEVYLAMTRKQHSLVDELDSFNPQQDPRVATSQTARPKHLKIQRAQADEIQAHETYLDGLDKAVGGTCVYRQNEAT